MHWPTLTILGRTFWCYFKLTVIRQMTAQWVLCEYNRFKTCSVCRRLRSGKQCIWSPASFTFSASPSTPYLHLERNSRGQNRPTTRTTRLMRQHWTTRHRRPTRPRLTVQRRRMPAVAPHFIIPVWSWSNVPPTRRLLHVPMATHDNHWNFSSVAVDGVGWPRTAVMCLSR